MPTLLATTLLAEAGVEVVGENRAQDLEAKHARYGDTFRWHFIGHLQSRKAKTVNRFCELVLDGCEDLQRRGMARSPPLGFDDELGAPVCGVGRQPQRRAAGQRGRVDPRLDVAEVDRAAPGEMAAALRLPFVPGRSPPSP